MASAEFTCCVLVTREDGSVEAVLGEGGTTTEVGAAPELAYTGTYGWADVSGLAGVGVFCVLLGVALRAHAKGKRALAQAHAIARGEDEWCDTCKARGSHRVSCTA